ncbi:MAG: YidC/Oxa1 family membrane protein insertase [Erysipelotrichaceae bacterium]|nr:YidC/Oxa1 family membrane protein insertase [Erysipelotrichaceae bacterium]
MKNNTRNRRFLIVACLFAVVFLAGCQSNVDSSGKTIAERIIYLTTPWSDMFDESIFSAILVYPLAQCINYIGTWTNSAVLGVVITTLVYNVITMGLSIKSTVNTQKIQMLQPELNKLQEKYQGRNDDNARMQMAQEMQALYNKYNVNPMSSLVTPFLTLPIMISMFYAAQRAEVVVNGSFMGVSLQSTPLDAFKNIKVMWPLTVIYIIMLIMQAISALLPQKLAEIKRKSQPGYKAYADNGSTNNQANTMMLSMIVLIGFLGIRWPTAMSVYWAISSLANILKTLFIQRRFIDNAKGRR